jgi:hypothetical protein
LTLLKAV